MKIAEHTTVQFRRTGAGRRAAARLADVLGWAKLDFTHKLADARVVVVGMTPRQARLAVLSAVNAATRAL